MPTGDPVNHRCIAGCCNLVYGPALTRYPQMPMPCVHPSVTVNTLPQQERMEAERQRMEDWFNNRTVTSGFDRDGMYTQATEIDTLKDCVARLAKELELLQIAVNNITHKP